MKYCRYCGKEVADEAVICLSCGCKIDNVHNINYTNAAKSLENTEDTTLSVSAFWCGIASFFIGWFVLGITAIILAYLSKSDTGGIMNSQAKTGFVCGIISTSLSILLIICLVSFFTSFI